MRFWLVVTVAGGRVSGWTANCAGLQFETLDWSLVMRDGRKLVLLDNSVADPYPQAAATPA